jgi:transcriptional regulator with XRE-family HTH domain
MDLQQRAFLEAVGRRVRQRREAQNLTQQELGERCGLHRTFIGSVERGERNVAVLNLRAIAVALRVPLAELFADEQDAGTQGAE